MRMRTLLVALTLSLTVAAQQAPHARKESSASTKHVSRAAKAGASQFPTLKYEKIKLPNGLEVILHEDHRLPLVAVNLWYHVGPANERPGRTGFAHLFEHMMFSGSKHVANLEHIKDLEGAGASDLNGTTDFDRTNYFETVPSNQLDLALWLESDRMGFLLDTLTAKKLATQRDVVRNERRQSVENRPYGLANEEEFHLLFPKSHPYYASVIGSHADIEAARIGDVREFFKQYYAPNNASMAIVGDFDRSKIRALVDKYFGPIPSGPPVPRIVATTPPITSEKRAVVTDQVELPRIYMAWITPPIFKPGDAEADLMAKILGGGKDSRLYKDLVYDKKIAQDVRVSQDSLMLGSVFEIEATAKQGVKPEDLEKAINDDLAEIRDKGPTQGELDRARTSFETTIIAGLERLGGFGGIADRLNTYNHYLGDPGYLDKDLQRYENVTVASLKKLADEKLTPNSRVVVYAVQGKKVIDDVARTTEGDASTPATAEESKSTTDAAWRSKKPPAGPLTKLQLPVPIVSKLANGLTLMLVERHNLPIVTSSLVVLSGTETNPADRPGLAAFTAAMLQEGTERRTSPQIAEEIDRLGATFNTNSTADNSNIFIRTLKKNSDAALDLISDLALHPTFNPAELDRVRQLRLTQILQQRDNPGTIANRVVFREIYGDKHPYGNLDLGTAPSLKALTQDQLRDFWKSGYVPGNSALVVAGDITMPQLRSEAEKYFGKWSGKTLDFKLPEVPENVPRKIIIVDKPGAPQTALRFAEVGLPRSSPDYATGEVLNAALGGLFSSRINLNLREKHGYTYGANSQFVFRHGPGPFIIFSNVRTDVTAPSVKEVFNEIDAIRAKPLTEEELSLSKDSIVRSMAGLFESSTNTVNTISQIFTYRLPSTYYRDYPAKVEAVNGEAAQTLAERVLKPGSMLVVAVGDRAKIEPELQKLDMGKIEIRDADANPVGVAATTGSH